MHGAPPKKGGVVRVGRRTELSYAVRLPTVLKHWGQLTACSAALTLIPLSVSIIAGEYDVSARYATVVAVLAICGTIFGRIKAPHGLQQNEALVIVALAFLSTPLVMTWPMMASGLPFEDAFFEAVSAITTTGLSTTDSVEDKPITFQFARAWMQWYGGLGVVALALAIVIEPGQLARRLSMSESDGHDVVGGTRAHFRAIITVYLVLTATGIVLLILTGLGPFNAILYSFSAVSTGGFAPHDASLAAVPPAATFTITILCVAASISFVAYHRAVVKEPTQFFTNSQLKALIALILAQTLALAWLFHANSDNSWVDAIWHGFMMGASAQSTAGFSSIPASDMDPVSKALMSIFMFIGGGAGSTAGGAKILRFLILVAVIRAMIVQTTMPARAVHRPRIGDSSVTDPEVRDALTIMFLGIFIVGATWIAFLAFGHDPLDALFDVVSATATVGISVGVVGPDLDAPLKYALCACMLLGRLEIVAWLVLFFPKTWLGPRKVVSSKARE